MYVPVFQTDQRDPEKWTQPVEGNINTFRTVNTGWPGNVELRPFYTFHDRRYTVYWDLLRESE